MRIGFQVIVFFFLPVYFYTTLIPEFVVFAVIGHVLFWFISIWISLACLQIYPEMIEVGRCKDGNPVNIDWLKPLLNDLF